MKNLTTTTEQNKKRIKFELKNKKYEIVVNPIIKIKIHGIQICMLAQGIKYLIT